MAVELTEDERIVLDFHPHWTTLLRSILMLVFIAVAAGAIIFFVPDWDMRTQIRLGVAAAALVVALAFSLVPFLRWFFTRYILTTHRLVIRVGIFSRTGRDIPLNRVNDAQFSHNLIQRLLGSGTLTVESGGENGQLVLRNIPRVETVQRDMYELINEPRAPRPPA
ncbi:PH domain-containing protein [Actinocorallia longicatena]|uniref:YdbS-like PH domain-containing protein n=1 Tax=Actinocorallia longicatena TaxID=111803 RepID=A0ABP6QDQ1_9ACTN